MQSRFPTPPRKTKTTFFASPAKMAQTLARAKPWILLDQGAPLPFPVAENRFLRVSGGENCKRWAELERILRWLASGKAERSQSLCVIGGGATLDLGAFAASLYRRGMPLTLVPTTLLGMVDATLGGKTAVDLELEGQLLKNFAGTFYPASEIWVLLDFLGTLPERERVSGAGEVLKTLWLKGGKWKAEVLAAFVESGKNPRSLDSLVRACLAYKARLVERDPLDQKRVREALNYGHTVGHALESLSGRPHGECVLWGMAVETAMLGKRGAVFAGEIRETIAHLGLLQPSTYSDKDWLAALGADKKIKGGRIEMSVVERPGKIARLRVEPTKMVEAIRAQLG